MAGLGTTKPFPFHRPTILRQKGVVLQEDLCLRVSDVSHICVPALAAQSRLRPVGFRVLGRGPEFRVGFERSHSRSNRPRDVVMFRV